MTTAFTGTIEQALAYANSRPVVLADVVAGQHLYHWTQDGTYTNTWKATPAGRVVGVSADGIVFTERASVADVNSNNGSWLWDGSTLWVNPYPGTIYDFTVIALVAFAWSNHPRDVDGVPYVPRLASTPELNLSIPTRFTQQDVSRGGNLDVEQAEGSTPTDPGAFDALADLDWDSGYVTVSFGADPVF